jgi:glycerol-3-phosphate dehydrogenase
MSSTGLDGRLRRSVFAALALRKFDLLVIGGGIMGAAIARDAALRGLTTALVDGRDYAGGTSGRTAKRLPGGWHHLAHGDLVRLRASVAEQKILRRIAPHLIKTVPCLMPQSSRFAQTLSRASLWLYETLAQAAPAERHQFWDEAEIALRAPLLRHDRQGGMIVYPEILVNDAKLTLANLRAAQQAGATLLNYAEVKKLVLTKGVVSGAEIVSALPGEANLGARIDALAVVNATGIWSDEIRALENPAAVKTLVFKKSTHIMVPHECLPVGGALSLTAANGARVFAVKHGTLTYIGAPEKFHDRAEETPDIARDDVLPLFDVCNEQLKIDRLSPEDIVSSWAGLRGLIGTTPNNAREVAQKQEIGESPGGLITVVGGDFGLHRLQAQRVVDWVGKKLATQLTRQLHPCATASEILPGGEITPVKLETSLTGKGMDIERAQRLIWLYGADAAMIAAHDDLVLAEITAAVCQEGAVRLQDWWLRRAVRHSSAADLEHGCKGMALLLGWDVARQAVELADCLRRPGLRPGPAGARRPRGVAGGAPGPPEATPSLTNWRYAASPPAVPAVAPGRPGLGQTWRAAAWF